MAAASGGVAVTPDAIRFFRDAWFGAVSARLVTRYLLAPGRASERALSHLDRALARAIMAGV